MLLIMHTLFILNFFCWSFVDSKTNSLPQSLRNLRFTGPQKIALGGVAALGLAIGKKNLDGPMFDENVSLKDKIVAITGANTGLGKETATKLATLGATVYILCRPSDKTDKALIDIKSKSGNSNIFAIPLDLSSLKSIKECASMLKSKVSRIDILVNNAGVMAIPELQKTEDGFEKQFGINHLGHFALTGLLFDLLKKSSSAR
jgi:hypothetical protein